MIGIYIHEGKYEKGEKGRFLVELAAKDYLENLGKQQDAKDNVNLYSIEVDQWGRPFFTHIPIDFSISHSGEMWMCALSEEPCGLDVQGVKAKDWEKISERYYSPEEQSFVRENGETGFFRIWVRREAVGKLIGRGFFSSMPSLVDQEGKLLEEIELDGGKALIREIEMSQEVFCALASYDKEEYEIRLLI